jgi:hypothetical protein
MTHFKGKLTSNEELALRLIGQQCVAFPIGEAHLKKSPGFEAILSTTWKALEDNRYIRWFNLWHFQITSDGWIELLRATGTLCDDTMKKHLGRLSKALKDRLDGRNEPVLVQTHVIVNEAGLPEYWVVNAIHSHLIRHCQQKTLIGHPTTKTKA